VVLKFSPASRPLEIVNGVPLESVKIPLGFMNGEPRYLVRGVVRVSDTPFTG